MPSPLIESVVLILHRAVASLLPTNLKGALLRGCCKFMLLILKRQVSFGYIFCAVCHVRGSAKRMGPITGSYYSLLGSCGWQQKSCLMPVRLRLLLLCLKLKLQTWTEFITWRKIQDLFDITSENTKRHSL